MPPLTVAKAEPVEVPKHKTEFVAITAVNEAGLMSIEKASVTALPEIKKEKKAALIRARISATTLEAIASDEGQTVKTALAINMKNKRSKLERKLDEVNHTMELIRTVIPAVVLVVQIIILTKI